VKADDFFVEEPDYRARIDADPWDSNPERFVIRTFDTNMMTELRRQELPGRSDLEVAIALASLVHDQLTAFGTDATQTLADAELEVALLALRAVTKRLGVPCELPFRNFTTFKTYWLRNEAYGSWQARRELLEGLFEPLHRKLIRMEELTFEGLASAISPRQATGWPAVDEEITELRRRFLTCHTAADYRDIGNRCVTLTELIGDAVYDADKHVKPGETPLSRGETKNRFDRYVETQLPGSDNAAARKLARSVIEFAQQTKHRTTPTRTEAGLAADAVIMLANILRRLQPEP